MKLLFSLAIVLSGAFPALAADIETPAKDIMAATTNNWVEQDLNSDIQKDYIDYFSDDFLTRVYSRDFAAKYRAAAKYPAYDEGSGPFDYDVIVMGQDGCSIKDLTLTAAAEKDGVTDVTASFDNSHCLGDRPSDWKPAQVHFLTIVEDGKPVVDDILRGADSSPQSLKAEMQQIVTSGEAAKTQGAQ